MTYHRIKVKHKILLLLSLAILQQIVFAQTDFRFGPELGISVTSHNQGYGYREEKISPFISPLIGISGLLKISNHFQLTTALQYEYIGYQTGPYNPEEIRYDKLCIPFTFSVAFGKSKIKPAVFIGYRPNLLLAGNKKTDWGGVSGINNLDPFSYDHPPKKYTNQFTTGLSTYFGKNLVINLSYSAGQLIEFGYTTTIIHHGVIPETRYIEETSVKNNEFAISLMYLFKSKKTTD